MLSMGWGVGERERLGIEKAHYKYKLRGKAEKICFAVKVAGIPVLNYRSYSLFRFPPSPLFSLSFFLSDHIKYRVALC